MSLMMVMLCFVKQDLKLVFNAGVDKMAKADRETVGKVQPQVTALDQLIETMATNLEQDYSKLLLLSTEKLGD